MVIKEDFPRAFKLGPIGTCGVLHNSKGEISILFSVKRGIRESNDVEVMAILEALWIFSSSFQDRLIEESDSFIAITQACRKELCFHLCVEFQHKIRSANSLTGALAKQGVDKVEPSKASIIWLFEFWCGSKMLLSRFLWVSLIVVCNPFPL